MGSVKLKTEFTVVQWNARSLCGHAMQHKKAELHDFLMSFKNLPEVVCIQETWNKQSQNLLKLLGYKEPISYRRKEANGGGVATFIRQGLDSEEIKYKQINPNLEVAIVRIFGTNKNTDIINIYTNGEFVISKGDFDKVLAHVGKHHIIVGDFNVRDSLWDNQYLGGETPAGRELLDFIEAHELVVLNKGDGTRYNLETGNSTAIDLTLASRDISKNHQWYVHEDCLSSDHFPLVTIFNKHFKSVLQDQPPRWKLDKADWALFRKLTDHVDIKVDDLSINELNEQFNSQLISICDKTIPKTKPNSSQKRRQLPWWNEDCTAAVSEKRRAWKKWKKHQTDQMKELYIIARTKSKDTLNKAKSDKWKEFISTLTHKTNSKHIWNVIAKFNGKPFKPVEVLKSNNVRYHDNKEKANALVKHYQKTSSDELLEPSFRLRKRELEPGITQTVNDCIMGGGRVSRTMTPSPIGKWKLP